MRVIGIDIGTTSICAAVLDSETGGVLEAVNADNVALLQTGAAFERLQDPAVILAQVTALTDSLSEKYAPVAGIGFSGQMHGILYLDQNGRPLSPLFTWQDGRGDLLSRDGKTYAQALSDLTGRALATGFGAVTHYYNTRNGLVPPQAAVFCTIQDYAAMTLAGNREPLTHSSDAASLGLFCAETNTFDTAAIAAAGMDPALFPKVTDTCVILGETANGIPVAAAIGDNQASFAGAVSDDASSLLVNIGTGSQISLFSREASKPSVLEARPFTKDGCLLVGSPLCGGRAFALLEAFFRGVVQAAGVPCESMYSAMDRLSERFEELENPLAVKTLFCGTRKNPAARGSISNLGVDNFTPEHFVAGVLWGIVDELYSSYAAEKVGGTRTTVIASGNGIRKSPVMRRMLELRFGMRVRVPKHREEAAYGAALFAMAATGVFPDLTAARRIIQYESDV